MPLVKFLQKYDHTWPSRAMTCYPAGYVGPVKREVARAAIEAGKAERVLPEKPAIADETQSL